MEKCPYCGKKVSPEKDVSDNYQRAMKQLSEATAELNRIAEAYERNGDFKKIVDVVSSYGKYKSIFRIDDVWRNFTVRTAGMALTKHDKDLQIVLKNHAKEYDEEHGTEYNGERSGDSLFRAMLSSHPRLGNNNDWDHLIISTHGNRDAFSKLCESILQYIVKQRDKAFAIDIFKLIKAKSTSLKALDNDGTRKDLIAERQDWIEVGENYIRAFLSSNEIADEVFTVEAFNGAAMKFVAELKKYCKKYLKGKHHITVEETKVFKNYRIAVGLIMKKIIIIISSVLAVIAAALISVTVYLSAINKDTIVFTVDKIIEITYGEELPLDGYYLTYRKNSGEEVKLPLTEKMLSGYDPDNIGSQQTVNFEFHGVSTSVTVLVSATQLDTPHLTQSGNYVTWDAIPHADSYAIFVNASEVKTNETSGLSYDLTANAAFGELTVTVRAMSSSGKYISSAMSAPLTVTKLEAPKNFEYTAGKLTWDAVTGAAGYELVVNGTPYVTSTPECVLSLNRGNNEITVIAKSSDKAVIHGVTDQYTLYYNRLDPITSMSYRDGSVYWQASADAKIFRVYVDGVQWKDFSRNNFSFENDGFRQTFGSGTHKIEIMCMTSVPGVESSDKKGSNIVFDNKISMTDGIIRWDNIGLGSTYFVYVNGTLYTYSDSYFSAADCVWQNGNNEVSILAKLNGEEYICETFSVKKHPTPTLSVSGAGWVTDNSGYELYSVNGGAWTDALPDITSMTAGEYTVRVKRTVSSPSAFEFESDVKQITVIKPKTPVIKLSAGVLDCSTFDSTVFTLVLEYFDADISSWTPISSISDLSREGDYRLRAYLRAKTDAAGADCYLLSDVSAEITASKPAAPDVIYDSVSGMLSSSVPGARFYYTDENGLEHEIVGGKVSNLPGGVFSVYARLNATQPGALHSENTPIGQRVSVFNLNIEFNVSPIVGSNQCYLVFKGCSEIDSLTYSYKISYLDAASNVIGGLDKSGTFVTQNKTSSSSDTISGLINYKTGGEFSGNYSYQDIAKIEVTVYISGGTETLQKTHTAAVK